MLLTILSVGKDRADPAAPLVADYVKRLNKFARVETRVLPPDRDDRIAAKMIKEGEKGGLLIALDERGKALDSVALSRLVDSWMNGGVSRVTFAIGGAEGLPAAVADRADTTLSLSKMTLPHRIARLVLVEQLYRAMCQLRGIPYHK